MQNQKLTSTQLGLILAIPFIIGVGCLMVMYSPTGSSNTASIQTSSTESHISSQPQIVSDNLGNVIDPAVANEAKFIGFKIEPFTSKSDGKILQMVRFKWKNVGKKPIYVLWANVTAYDSNNNIIDEGDMTKQCIFSYGDASGPVKPGDTFQDKHGNGLLLLPRDMESVNAKRVTVNFIGGSNRPNNDE